MKDTECYNIYNNKNILSKISNDFNENFNKDQNKWIKNTNSLRASIENLRHSNSYNVFNNNADDYISLLRSSLNSLNKFDFLNYDINEKKNNNQFKLKDSDISLFDSSKSNNNNNNLNYKEELRTSLNAIYNNNIKNLSNAVNNINEKNQPSCYNNNVYINFNFNNQNSNFNNINKSLNNNNDVIFEERESSSLLSHIDIKMQFSELLNCKKYFQCLKLLDENVPMLMINYNIIKITLLKLELYNIINNHFNKQEYTLYLNLIESEIKTMSSNSYALDVPFSTILYCFTKEPHLINSNFFKKKNAEYTMYLETIINYELFGDNAFIGNNFKISKLKMYELISNLLNKLETYDYELIYYQSIYIIEKENTINSKSSFKYENFDNFINDNNIEFNLDMTNFILNKNLIINYLNRCINIFSASELLNNTKYNSSRNIRNSISLENKINNNNKLNYPIIINKTDNLNKLNKNKLFNINLDKDINRSSLRSSIQNFNKNYDISITTKKDNLKNNNELKNTKSKNTKFNIMKNINFKFLKRENVDKKTLTKFKIFLRLNYKSKNINLPDIINDYCLNKITPPFCKLDYNNYKKKIAFKSLNTSYLIWLFSYNEIYNLYEEFVECELINTVEFIINSFKINDLKEVELLTYYIKLIGKFYSNATVNGNKINSKLTDYGYPFNNDKQNSSNYELEDSSIYNSNNNNLNYYKYDNVTKNIDLENSFSNLCVSNK